MPLEPFFALVILAILIAGSYTDLKTREVPDWVNYGFLFTAFGIRAIYSAAKSDWTILAYGAFGFIACVILAYVMFYAGQWGGGDAKLIMGLGALIGMELSFSSFLVSFLLNVFLVGAVYAIFWSFYLVAKHWKKFLEEINKLNSLKKIRIIKRVVLISGIILLIIGIVMDNGEAKLVMIAFSLLYIITFYLWIFVRIVERSCMLKRVSPEKLTEGDWIAKDVVVAGKRITGPKDLGVTKEQIAELIRLKKKRKIKQIMIKEGIPFVPSFLFAFIATWFFGNLFLLFIR